MSYPAAIVELDESELWFVERVAEKRDADGLRLRRTPTLGTRDLSQDVLGAAGECGLARFTGLVWNAVRDDPSGLADVGDSFECKAVRSRSHSLLVPGGKLRADRTYFLVLVERGRVEVLGAVEGSVIGDADVDKSLPQPAYRIRQRDPRFIRGEALERYRVRLRGADERRAA